MRLTGLDGLLRGVKARVDAQTVSSCVMARTRSTAAEVITSRTSAWCAAACWCASTSARRPVLSQNLVPVMSATTTAAPEASAQPSCPETPRSLAMSISAGSVTMTGVA
jgi:hypothetical protein